MTIARLIGRQSKAPIGSDKNAQSSTLSRFFSLSRNRRDGYESIDTNTDGRRQPFLSQARLPALCEECQPPTPMANVRTLRIISVLSLLPGFGLLVASAVICQRIVPAIGLLPLFFSSGFGLLLLLTGSEQSATARPRSRNDDGGESLRPGPEEREASRGLGERHPILVFLADVILATSLMIVLVFTFIRVAWYGGADAVLVAYATMPLLLNFFIHTGLALQELFIGTGLAELAFRVRYQGIPVDCPGCGTNIRPSTPLTPPWFQSVSVPKISYRQIRAGVPVILDRARGIGRDWATPARARGEAGHEGESLIANQEGVETGHGVYRDSYDDDAVNIRGSLDVPDPEEAGGPSAGEVVSRRDSKGKGY